MPPGRPPPLAIIAPISALVHAGAILALMSLTDGENRSAERDAAVIELLEATAELAPEQRPADDEGGAAPSAGAPTAAPALTARATPRPSPSPAREDDPAPLDSDPSETTAAEAAPGSVVGNLGDALTDGVGGGGRGRGKGGAASGDGGGTIPWDNPISAPPLPPPPSKARPAVLIYPSRQRDVEEERLYIVTVNVDAKGYVSGVRLVRGQDMHADGKALDAVWRFRYDPARDDAGKPIASVVTQSFMVNW